MDNETILIIVGAISTLITGVITKYFAEKSKYNKNMIELSSSISNLDQTQNETLKQLTLSVNNHNEIFAQFHERFSNIENEIFFLKENINNLQIDIKSLNSDNEKFKEASLIPEAIEKKCNDYLNSIYVLNPELKAACQRGIEQGAHYFKRLYFKKNIDPEHETQMLINIFKDIRSSVTIQNIRVSKPDDFLTEIKAALISYSSEIIKNIKKFRAEYYNGKTLDKYLEVSTSSINNIISIVVQISNKY